MDDLHRHNAAIVRKAEQDAAVAGMFNRAYLEIVGRLAAVDFATSYDSGDKVVDWQASPDEVAGAAFAYAKAAMKRLGITIEERKE